MSVQQVDNTVGDIVVAHWLAALEYDDPEPDDDWFDFGGDSLGAVQLLSRLEREGLVADIADFFRAPTLASLVRLAGTSSPAEPEAATTAGSGSCDTSAFSQLPLTSMQLYTVMADGDTRDWHNDHLTVRLCEHATRDRVKHAVRALAVAHPALTAAFSFSDGRWTQSVRPAARRAIPVVAVPVKGHDDHAPVDATVRGLGTLFNIARGEVSTALVWEDDSTPVALTLLFHHLCADGHSADVLQHDLVAALHDPSDAAPAEDNYVSWLARLAEETDERPSSVPRTSYGEETAFPVGGLRHTTLHVQAGDLSSRQIAPALLAAMSRAVREMDDPRAHSLDMTWHGRDPIRGWPSLATTVGWFSQLRRVELPSGADWTVPDAARALESFETDNTAYVTGDSSTALLTAPAALYLNYRGSLRSTLYAPVGDCLPVDVDFGPQSSPDATTPYHLRCVADRVDGSIRLGIKYRPDSALAAAVINSLRAGVAL
ncbi:phosphopantetheine-binding protein [Streptomyces sp. NBC_01210]|uniref:phosphopantetheine-binding protein n=1 Tax=Streptomyces sp. NBC_01210 TaxID=2903774 RepID=UPI002E142BD0|nr:phosphopantetheine-binding protein [Streptomyces sp. NBC_01210]